MKLQRMTIYFACMALTMHVSAAETFSSGPNQTTLIELYTSEGCSSCPPAEERMNAFIDHKSLWEEFVPVAFHVDYWNYLGWSDRFSSPDYTARQRQYSKTWRASTIYTPCFVRNGEPDRNPKLSRSHLEPGILTATIADGMIDVIYSPNDQQSKKLTVWVAPLSGKVSTSVKSGENRGRNLKHSFVALDLENKPMKQDGKTFTATLPFTRETKPMAVAVWISRAGSLEPIQSAGGWLE